MGRNVIMLFLINLSYGCAIVPLTTVFAGISAVSTTGNQTYQAYKTKMEGEEIMRCIPQEDKSLICKPERIQQSTNSNICDSDDRIGLPKECYSDKEICSMCLGEACADKYCKQDSAGDGKGLYPSPLATP